MENKEVIKEVASANDTAKGVFSLFSKRKRYQRTTNLSLLKRYMIQHGLRLVDEDFEATFKRLEEAGVGTIKRTKQGGARFVWCYNLKELAKLAQGETIDPHTISTQVQAKSRRGRPKGSKNKPKGLNGIHVKPVKGGAFVSITLPKAILDELLKK